MQGNITVFFFLSSLSIHTCMLIHRYINIPARSLVIKASDLISLGTHLKIIIKGAKKKATGQTGKRNGPLKGFYLLPIISNCLVYPSESRSGGTITALSVHSTLVKGKLILNYWPHNCLLFHIICQENKQTIAS